MLFLAGSILLTSYLILAFKVLERLGLNAFQAIVFNYITCVATGAAFSGSIPYNMDAVSSGWFGWAMLMGSMFILLFNLVGVTARRTNVAVTSIAYKLSLVIPVVFGIYLYNDQMTALQWLGILAAVVSIILTCWAPYKTGGNNSNRYLLFVLPLVLFIGSGLLDTMIKFVEETYINDVNQNAYLISAFASAASIGLVVLMVQILRGKQRLNWKNVLAGVAIGIPNYFSIWCFIEFLKNSPWPSSAAIPLNNLGIILFSTLVASVFLRERLSRINLAGIAMSVLAILLIAFG